MEVVKSGFCSKKTTVAGEALGVLCATHHLDQHIHHPTPGENTLALVLSNFTTTVSTNVLVPLRRSDHAILICNFKAVSARRDPTTSHKVWKYDSADWNRLSAFYHGHDWHIMMTASKTETRVKANHSSKTDKRMQIKGKEGKGGDKPAGCHENT